MVGKMKIIANNFRVQYDENSTAELVISTNLCRIQIQSELTKLKEITSKGKQLEIEIKERKKKRSLDANAMLWVMCQKIAEILRSTKEDIYRRAIREVGVFEIVPIANEAVSRWIECWNEKGIGWYSEKLSDSKLEGYIKTINYYGSSVYNTKEMSRLLDHIITDAKEAGIDVMTESEKNLLLQAWGNKKVS